MDYVIIFAGICASCGLAILFGIFCAAGAEDGPVDFDEERL